MKILVGNFYSDGHTSTLHYRTTGGDSPPGGEQE